MIDSNLPICCMSKQIPLQAQKSFLASSPLFWSKLRGYNLSEREITYMSLNQDSICDCNCAGCFRYLQRKFGCTNLLEMPDYIRLLDEFVRYGGLAIEISGEGEPMLSPYTLPIIRHADKLGLWTTLITNGHNLNNETIQELAYLRVALVLSMHSLDEKIYEDDNQLPGSYQVKMQTIEKAAEVFGCTSWMESGEYIRRLALHWTVQGNNQYEVAEVQSFCRKRDIHFSIAPLAANVGHAKGRPELWLPTDSTLDKINSMGDRSIIFTADENERQVCGTCHYGLNIGCDGNLLLDAHGGYDVEIANIREISFREAIDLQHSFSNKMFKELDSFCPLRDPKWQNFLDKKMYL